MVKLLFCLVSIALILYGVAILTLNRRISDLLKEISTKVSRKNRIAIFQKVSVKQFIEDFRKLGVGTEELTDDQIKNIYKGIKLPTRASSGSAGYDFYLPLGISIAHGCSVVIPTGIRCKIKDGFCLNIIPKSGLGFKYRVMIGNTIGLIDSDYYCSDNEGHIMVKIVNDGYNPSHRAIHYEKFSDYELTVVKENVKSTAKDKVALKLEQGNKFCQGVFLPYFITDDDNVTDTRNGGFGSTGA